MEINEVLKRLAAVEPYLRTAVEIAKNQVPEATETLLAIVRKREDGSGAITGTFLFDDFLADLKLVAKYMKDIEK